MENVNQFVNQVSLIRNENANSFYEISYEKRKLKKSYIYARGSEDYDDIIFVRIGKDGCMGIAECSPFPSFFGWSVDRVLDDVKKLADQFITRINFKNDDHSVTAPARSAMDLALIDLECNKKNKTVFDLYGLSKPKDILISHTVEFESLNELEKRLSYMTYLPLLKVKLGSDGLDIDRLQIVREHCASGRIIVDVNGAWTFDYFKKIIPDLIKYKVEMIEQPLKKGDDMQLKNFNTPIPIYADESFSNVSDLMRLRSCYDGFNIKLDKIGGLTSALDAVGLCQKNRKGIMLGCLSGTSILSSAGLVVAQFADYVDLDNHLWLCQDRQPSLGGEDGIIQNSKQRLWGMGKINSANLI